jgi:predicted transposase YbfD/YdcC
MVLFPYLAAALATLVDPRRGQGQRYPFQPLLLFIVLAMMSNALTYTTITTYIQERWLLLNELSGSSLKRAPCLNTVRTLMQRLNPQQMEQGLRQHAQDLLQARSSTGETLVVALDGKTLRGSYDHAEDQTAAQILSAYATKYALVLAQIDIQDKSNEIPAAQEMIRALNLEGAIYTADAIHCQKKTFEAAKETNSSLIVQVKENQPTLLATCQQACETTKPASTYKTVDAKARNREEHRLVEMFPLNDAIRHKLQPNWGDSIVAVARVTRKVWEKDTKAKACPRA